MDTQGWIDPRGTVDKAIRNMSDGNENVVAVLHEILKRGTKIDPDNTPWGLEIIGDLDACRIYGSKIWRLHHDVCHDDLIRTVAMVRALQLSLISKEQFNATINDPESGVDVEDILKQVQEQLPRFGK